MPGKVEQYLLVRSPARKRIAQEVAHAVCVHVARRPHNPMAADRLDQRPHGVEVGEAAIKVGFANIVGIRYKDCHGCQGRLLRGSCL